MLGTYIFTIANIVWMNQPFYYYIVILSLFTIFDLGSILSDVGIAPPPLCTYLPTYMSYQILLLNLSS